MVISYIKLSFILVLFLFTYEIFAKSDETELKSGEFVISLNDKMQSTVSLYKLFSIHSGEIIEIFANGRKIKPDVKLRKMNSNGMELIQVSLEGQGVNIELSFSADPAFPNTFIVEGRLENNSDKETVLNKYSILNFTLDATKFGADSSHKFWTFQGGSFDSRRDWIFPLTNKFYSRNFMGMNAADYGGGMPLVDFWTKKAGVTFCSLSEKQELISFPVQVTGTGKVEFSVTDTITRLLKPGEKYVIPATAIIAHTGDYFNALKSYSGLINKKWFSPPQEEQQALEPEWCAWGYDRNFSTSQIRQTIPLAQELGFKWTTLDDGWQNADGDWTPDLNKFPGGEAELIKLVDFIHNHNMKARLWWVPLSVSDSAYNAVHYPERMNERTMRMQSRLAIEHPDWFILDEKGNRIQISWWNTYYLCPAAKEVRDYYKEFVRKAISEWGFDGFKIDGQNFNAVPPCYNPAHKHESPYESVYAVSEYFADIYKTAVGIKSGAVIQLCPCGTNFSVYNIPYTNQYVGSDPTSSWQVRLRAKTYRALTGRKIAYSGDHVELTNRKWNEKKKAFEVIGPEDFASTVGTGGVIATKFTSPEVTQQDSSLMLTPEKKDIWQKWMNIYEQERISEGEYLNLYDIAYDYPEAHLIKRGENLYYSFFIDGSFEGKIELRGLEQGNYEIIDFVNKVDLGKVSSENPYVHAEFEKSLMIRLKKL